MAKLVENGPAVALTGKLSVGSALGITRSAIQLALVGQAPIVTVRPATTQSFDDYSAQEKFKLVFGPSGENVFVAPKSMTAEKLAKSLDRVSLQTGLTTQKLGEPLNLFSKKNECKELFNDAQFYPYCSPDGSFPDFTERRRIFGYQPRGLTMANPAVLTITGAKYSEGSPNINNPKPLLASTLRGLEKQYGKEIIGYRAINLENGADGRTRWFVAYYQDAGNKDLSKIRAAQFAIAGCPRSTSRGLSHWQDWKNLAGVIDPVLPSVIEHYFKGDKSKNP